MRVFPVRGKGIGVHAKKIFARRRVIHRSCGEQTLRALLASVNNSGGTISLGVALGRRGSVLQSIWLVGGFRVALGWLCMASRGLSRGLGNLEPAVPAVWAKTLRRQSGGKYDVTKVRTTLHYLSSLVTVFIHAATSMASADWRQDDHAVLSGSGITDGLSYFTASGKPLLLFPTHL